MALILDLPAELVIGIASHLTTLELGSLRRSCKQLEQYLFETFATEFFTKRQFMIEHASLKALVDISNHPTLSDRLVEVIISTDMLEYPRPSDAQYAADDVSREWLLRTGQARDMLAEAFSKLKNLRIVGLRDFSAKGRLREGPEELWKSYAWSMNTHDSVRVVMEQDRNPGTIFSLVLLALGTAQASPRDIQVILRKRETLIPHAFKVNAVTTPVVSKLRTLFLALHAENSTFSTATAACEAPLRRFLHTAANLETLRLNFDSRWSTASRLLNWLGTSPVPTDSSIDDPSLLLIPPAPLCNLTTLEIGMATVSASSLAQSLSRFKLKSFSLWRITLSDRDPSNLSFDQWSRFFGNLSEALNGSDNVQKIIIGLLAQISPYGPRAATWEKVQICPEGTADKATLKADELPKEAMFRARYGLSASHWLKALSERTYVGSLHAPPSSPDSESDGEDDEDSGDDEVYDSEAFLDEDSGDEQDGSSSEEA